MSGNGFRGLGKAALVAAYLVSLSTAAGAAEGSVAADRMVNGAISVDTMPPIMREAYLDSIREQLAAHGYGPGPGRDGLASAIRAYQRKTGLPVDGVASKELLDHIAFVLPLMRMARAVTADRAPPDHERRRWQYEAPTPIPPPPGVDDTLTSEELPPPVKAVPRQRANRPKPPQAAPRQSPGKPSRGRGGFVSRVQDELKRRGYYEGPVDGAFGPRLSKAIRRFQRKRGLPVTGVIDGPLLNALTSVRGKPVKKTALPSARVGRPLAV